MKAQELRISNVIDFEGRNAIVKEIDSVGVKVVFDDGEDIWIDLFQFQPIPLTEDWLIKFGFEKDEYDPYYDLLFFEVRFYEGAYVYNPISEYFPAYGIGLEYVHELQNLYFALTGEELSIKY